MGIAMSNPAADVTGPKCEGGWMCGVREEVEYLKCIHIYT